jgi:hypothetical protein
MWLKPPVLTYQFPLAKANCNAQSPVAEAGGISLRISGIQFTVLAEQDGNRTCSSEFRHDNDEDNRNRDAK